MSLVITIGPKLPFLFSFSVPLTGYCRNWVSHPAQCPTFWMSIFLWSLPWSSVAWVSSGWKCSLEACLDAGSTFLVAQHSGVLHTRRGLLAAHEVQVLFRALNLALWRLPSWTKCIPSSLNLFLNLTVTSSMTEKKERVASDQEIEHLPVCMPRIMRRSLWRFSTWLQFDSDCSLEHFVPCNSWST